MEVSIIVLARISNQIEEAFLTGSWSLYFPTIEKSIRREGSMRELMGVIIPIIKVLGSVGLCYAASLIVRFGIAVLVCRHPSLSDDKVKYITQMFSKDHHFFRK